MKTLIRWVLRAIGGAVVLLVVLCATVTFVQLPIDLTRFKHLLEDACSNALQRPVTIERSIVLTTSLKPVFTVNGLHIANPDEFAGDTLLFLERGRLQLELLPLLRRKVHVADIEIENLEVNLERLNNGEVNWTLFAPDTAQSQTDAAPEVQSETNGAAGQAESPDKAPRLTGDALIVRNLLLTNLVVTSSVAGEESDKLSVATCSGTMLPGEPLQLNLTGTVRAVPYQVDIGLASLEEFLKKAASWVEIEAKLAGTDFLFTGELNLAPPEQAVLLTTEISGAGLESLNGLLRLDLPPLGPYRLKSRLTAQKGLLRLEDLQVSAGSSSLNGTAEFDTREPVASAQLALGAPLIQINDFLFDDWSWRQEANGPAGQSEEQAQSPGDPGAQRLLEPENLAKVNLQLTISADEVLSGEDRLGGGSLTATLRDGRISLEPLELQLPGGELRLAASLKPGQELAEATLQATISNFDIGVIVRQVKPEAKLGGLVNLDAELTSSAASIAEILANGNGYLDFSGQLTNLKAGILDLWAVNLIAAIVTSTDESESQINCALARWNLTDGLLTPDPFVIDTTKMRICANGTVNLKDQTVDLRVVPQAKRAEFFSLATPLRIEGGFDQIGVDIARGGVLTTAVRFIASPVTTPIKRVFLDNVPADGSDVCQLSIGLESRSGAPVAGCK